MGGDGWCVLRRRVGGGDKRGWGQRGEGKGKGMCRREEEKEGGRAVGVNWSGWVVVVVVVRDRLDNNLLAVRCKIRIFFPLCFEDRFSFSTSL